MAAFNHRHLFRAVSPSLWRVYARARRLPLEVDEATDDTGYYAALIQAFDALPSEASAPLLTELRRVYALSDRRGVDALLNASEHPEPVREDFASMRNDSERALWALLTWPNTFDTAETLLIVDLAVGKRGWKRQDLRVSVPISREPEHLALLESAVRDLFAKREGAQRACKIEVCERHVDAGVQLNIYLEDDPNDLVEFVGAELRRRPTRPVANFALVYYPHLGVVDTVGRGGKRTHDALVEQFSEHLLGRRVKPESLKAAVFHLGRLRNGLEIRDGSLNLADEGIQVVRLRQVRLLSIVPPFGELRIHAKASAHLPCAIEFARAHFREHDPLRRGFAISEAIIAIHFAPSAPGKAGRVLVLRLKRDGVSNLPDLDPADAALVTRLLAAWGVSDAAPIDDNSRIEEEAVDAEG
jgi:hypothetical protein